MVSLFHQLQSFSPAFDNLIYLETGRFATFVGTIEFRAINEPATIVNQHLVIQSRAAPCPGLLIRYCRPLSVVVMPGFLAIFNKKLFVLLSLVDYFLSFFLF